MIDIDLDARTLNVRVDAAELDARLAALPSRTREIRSRWLRRYAKLVTSASTGAVLRD